MTVPTVGIRRAVVMQQTSDDTIRTGPISMQFMPTQQEWIVTGSDGTKFRYAKFWEALQVHRKFTDAYHRHRPPSRHERDQADMVYRNKIGTLDSWATYYEDVLDDEGLAWAMNRRRHQDGSEL